MLSEWGKGRGGVANPVTREEVLEKFRKVTARHLKPAAQETIIEQCSKLDTAAHTGALIAALPNAA